MVCASWHEFPKGQLSSGCPFLYIPTPRAALESPRAALAIPACGVGNLRVRRLQFPRAAFVNLIGKKA